MERQNKKRPKKISSMSYEGIITTKTGSYIFRSDVQDGHKYWAWEIHDDYSQGKTHKWNKLPKGEIELFDIDIPPATVKFIPILN